MPQYIVLQPISPDQGPLIVPSVREHTAPDVEPPPVIVDETIISDAAAPILIAQGVIALLPADLPADSAPDAGAAADKAPRRRAA